MYFSSVTLPDGETTIRMVDDAFIRICSAVNDLCMQVRALACSLLGSTRAVSDRFLLQTLDKQLMSNMKVIYRLQHILLSQRHSQTTRLCLPLAS